MKRLLPMAVFILLCGFVVLILFVRCGEEQKSPAPTSSGWPTHAEICLMEVEQEADSLGVKFSDEQHKYLLTIFEKGTLQKIREGKQEGRRIIAQEVIYKKFPLRAKELKEAFEELQEERTHRQKETK